MSQQDPAVQSALGAMHYLKKACAIPIVACRGFQKLAFAAPGKISNALGIHVPARFLAAAMNFGSDLSTGDKVLEHVFSILQSRNASLKQPLPPEKSMPEFVRRVYKEYPQEQIDSLFSGQPSPEVRALEIKVRLKLHQYTQLPDHLKELSAYPPPPHLVRDFFYCGVPMSMGKNEDAGVLSENYYNADLVADANNRASGYAMGYGIAAMALVGSALLSLQLLGISHDELVGVGAGLDTFNPAVIEHARETASAWASFMNGVQSAVLAVIPLSAAPTVASYMRKHFIRKAVTETVMGKALRSGLHKATKDTHVEYNLKKEKFAVFWKSWLHSLKEDKRLGHQAMFNIGLSTGVMRARGFAGGREVGSVYKIPLTNMYQNLIIFGGTGSGKTLTVILPLVRQIFRMKNSGALENAGWFAIDPKATFPEKIKTLAVEEGQSEDDIIVIGADDKDYGCNITKGVMPVELTTWIDTIARMSGSGDHSGGSGFYKSQSGYWGTQFAKIAYAYSHSIPGLAYQERTGSDPYCLDFIFNIATDDDRLDEICSEIQSEIVDGRLTSDLVNSENSGDNINIVEAMHIVNTKWQDMEKAKETKQNIQATLLSDLGPLLVNDRIKRKFFAGFDNLTEVDAEGNEMRDENGNLRILPNNGTLYADVDFCFQGRGVCININTSKEGEAGAHLIKMLASRLRILSSRREVAWNAITQENMRSADYDPDNNLDPQDYPVFYIADEYQDLVMRGGTKLPVGDDSYWNKNRSSGVIPIIATQSVAAIEQSMGQDATNNMLNNFRNKILLSSEDLKTFNVFKDLAGEGTRMQTYSKDYYERQSSREQDFGGVMHSPSFALESDAAFAGDILAGSYVMFTQEDKLSHQEQKRYLDSVDAEQANINSNPMKMGEQAATEIQIEQQLTSMEDKERSNGNTEVPLIKINDVVHDSRMFAVIINQCYTQTSIEQVELFNYFDEESERIARQAA